MGDFLSAAQMRAIEQAAIASGAVTGLELMERAGEGVVEAILEEWPDLEGGRGAGPPPSTGRPDEWRNQGRPPEYLRKGERPCRAVVLCGPGNNGGDGFVAARLLEARGWAVEVFLYGDPERLPPDAKVNFARWQRCAPVRAFEAGPVCAAVAGTEGGPLCVIDALFGIGISRALPQAVTGLRPSLGAAAARIVAIDLPSGLCSDTGRDYGAIPAHLTVTFHQLKAGHAIGAGPRLCGKSVVKDIGL